MTFVYPFVNITGFQIQDLKSLELDKQIDMRSWHTAEHRVKSPKALNLRI